MTQAVTDAVASAVSTRPLCVDLDGTLIKSDTLFDSLCYFVRKHPLESWKPLLWILGGRARLKEQVAKRAQIDVSYLPYNAELVRYLEQQRKTGRALYLTTGADRAVAERVAGHLGLFDEVLASDGVRNLTRREKLDRLRARFGGFDYIGNSRADLVLLAGAQQAMVANPTLGLRLSLGWAKIPVAATFTERKPPLRTLVKAIRVHQWAKNVLLAAPLVLSHHITGSGIAAVTAAFFCFSFIASANYLVNDMLDIESDRHHPAKRLRPFAAGDLSVASGVVLALALVVAAAALLPFLDRAFVLWLLFYIVVTMSYSLYLKRIAIVDVLLLSGLYTLRLLAGGAATGTEISQWLAGFSSFLFLSLAMVKRFSELENLGERGATKTHGRGYLVADSEQIRSFGTASAYAAVVVFMLYIGRPDVTALYHHPSRLWLIVPLLIYWLNRVWLLASRGELDDDPVVFAMRDPMSLVVGAGVLLLAVFAA